MDMGKARDQALYTESPLLENCLRKDCGKQKNLSAYNPSCEKLSGLEGQLGTVSPRSCVGQGFSVGTGSCWEQGWHQESVMRWNRSLFGDQVVLHYLELNKSTENNKPAPQKELGN